MAIDPSSFTAKTNELLLAGQQLALDGGSSQGITPLHLLLAFYDENRGILSIILDKLEVNKQQFSSNVRV